MGMSEQKMREALKECDDYLSANKMSSIGSGSILHKQIKEALAQPLAAVVELTDADCGPVWDGNDDGKTGADHLLDMGW